MIWLSISLICRHSLRALRALRLLFQKKVHKKRSTTVERSTFRIFFAHQTRWVTSKRQTNKSHTLLRPLFLIAFFFWHSHFHLLQMSVCLILNHKSDTSFFSSNEGEPLLCFNNEQKKHQNRREKIDANKQQQQANEKKTSGNLTKKKKEIWNNCVFYEHTFAFMTFKSNVDSVGKGRCWVW